MLGVLSLPGHRWRQNNGNRDDGRIWTNARWHVQSAAYWADIARITRGHPALVGYNPLNEPHPRKTGGPKPKKGESIGAWSKRVKGTPADVNVLYRAIIGAIRTVDKTTPIILDAPAYAHPSGFDALEPVKDKRVLYSLHLYEPWTYTTWRKNRGKLSYPGTVDGQRIDPAHFARVLATVDSWQRRHGIAAKRIVVGEFGADRRVPGVERYLSDTIAAFEQRGWHWAFYSYREDTWPGFDYEVGSGTPGQAFWKGQKRGEYVAPIRRQNPAWKVLTRVLRR